jgi:hypothetical protein
MKSSGNWFRLLLVYDRSVLWRENRFPLSSGSLQPELFGLQSCLAFWTSLRVSSGVSPNPEQASKSSIAAKSFQRLGYSKIWKVSSAETCVSSPCHYNSAKRRLEGNPIDTTMRPVKTCFDAFLVEKGPVKIRF